MRTSSLPIDNLQRKEPVKRAGSRSDVLQDGNLRPATMPPFVVFVMECSRWVYGTLEIKYPRNIKALIGVLGLSEDGFATDSWLSGWPIRKQQQLVEMTQQN